MDSLLEHYMPSLMALKKALLGIQPRSFRESFISVECFYIVLKQKNKEGNSKLFKKESESERETCIVEVGEPLNFVHAHGNFINLNYRNFSTKIITPLYNSIVL